jgi:NTE family protein
MLRQLSHRRQPHTVFVLGGGGNLGAVQIGMLRALMERGITPDALVGCSVGAINSAALACDPSLDGVERMTKLWRELDGEVIAPSGRISGLLLLTRKYKSLQSNEGLRGVLEQSLPIRRFEEAEIPVHVNATSLADGLERWFDRGPLIDPVLASAALPAMFPPVEIEGETFVDGGVVNNVPIDRARQLGAERIVVLHVGNFARPRPEPRRPIDALLQSFSIARNHRFATECRTEAGDAELLVLPGLDPGPLRPNDFSHSTQLIERAYHQSASFLDARDRAASGA